MRDLDRAIFFWIHEWPVFLEPWMRFFSEGIKTNELKLSLIALLVGMAVAGGRTRRTAVMALASVIFASILTEALKNVFPTLRPSVALLDSLQRSVGLTGSGTASSHAANMAAVTVVFASELRWWGVIWGLVALFTGLSRIYDASHFPFQVLIGWACGVFCGMLVVRTWREFLIVRSGRKVDNENAVPGN